MDVMDARRRILAADSGGYVRSGLVLWMDGIDKGTTAGAWTDRAAGHVFTAVNGFEDGSNYVGLNAASSQYFVSASFPTQVEPADGTIEVVASDYGASMLVFMPHASGLCFGFGGTQNQIITGAKPSMGAICYYPNGAKLFSINYSSCLIDGNAVAVSSRGYFAGTDDNTYIGRRGTGFYFSGKIFAIRLYNRKLSSAEMLHNQRIDNRRYHLGLSI